MMEHCSKDSERHCTLAIYFIKSHFLVHCRMVIVWKFPSCGMYMCMFIPVHIRVHIRTYLPSGYLK